MQVREILPGHLDQSGGQGIGHGGIMKVTHNPIVVEGFKHTGIPGSAISFLGALELFCLALYLIPRTTVLGTLLLTGYLGGAVLANLINGSDFIHAVVVGLFVWAGAWLRVPAFRTLIPIRETGDARNVEEAAHAMDFIPLPAR